MPHSKLIAPALVAFLSLLGTSASAQPTGSTGPQWRLQDGSSIRFVCAGEGIRNPAGGRFAMVTSAIQLDPRNLSTASGTIEILLSSITTEDAGWDQMFRSAPFLTLDEYPRSRFELQRVEGARALSRRGWVEVRLVGQLTVRGVTRPRTLPARMRWNPANHRVEVRTSLEIPWTEFQINVPRGWTRQFVGDHANVSVELTYERR